ncbi:30S ribosomal protein S2 [bacterium]|jgi:small subunit ribosomal protein S2|nr:30S ribosomal protein S2 [bacterium]MBT4251589.1 30S ribosomal protein S2 [bacterium]MBT4597638.1 30S ribosomal protein S2 [bacterium]MBT6753651.1 30S ribosomal protein S2 [bacterium]MBT7037788.1 30S ribosomal protein S2 [bacterium]
MTEEVKEAKKVAPKEGVAFDVAENATDKYELSLEGMLKAGVHFGHKKSRWNPKMGQFIFGVRNGIHIIDLEKSLVLFEKALERIGRTVAKGGTVMIVGTKKQSKDLVKAVADKLEYPYVNERWLGGTFTNFDIIKKRVKFFTDNTDALAQEKLKSLTKLERHKLQKRLDKIEEKMGGLVRMNRLPDLVIALDVKKEELAIKEAHLMGIPVVGLVDTNSDHTSVEAPIPANDDALSSLKYILGVFLKKMMEAKSGIKEAETKKQLK